MRSLKDISIPSSFLSVILYVFKLERYLPREHNKIILRLDSLRKAGLERVWG